MNKIVTILKLLVLGTVITLVATFAWFYIEYLREVSGLVELGKSDAGFVIDSRDSISFFAIGDTGSGLPRQRDIAVQMDKRCHQKKPAGILLLGDVVYPKGVTSASDPQWLEKVFSVYSGKCLDTVAIYPVLGNHDYLGNTQSWIEVAKLNDRWKFPSRHYSIVFTDLLTVYALDTHYPFNIKNHGIPRFGKSSTPWTIAIGHHPLQSASGGGGGHRGNSFKGYILRRMLCNSVDAYLSGHSHHMEYDRINRCGLDHYISGAGGGTLQELEKNHTALFASAEYGFLELEVSPMAIKGQFFSRTGQSIFQTSTIKQSKLGSSKLGTEKMLGAE